VRGFEGRGEGRGALCSHLQPLSSHPRRAYQSVSLRFITTSQGAARWPGRPSCAAAWRQPYLPRRRQQGRPLRQGRRRPPGRRPRVYRWRAQGSPGPRRLLLHAALLQGAALRDGLGDVHARGVQLVARHAPRRRGPAPQLHGAAAVPRRHGLVGSHGVSCCCCCARLRDGFGVGALGAVQTREG